MKILLNIPSAKLFKEIKQINMIYIFSDMIVREVSKKLTIEFFVDERKLKYLTNLQGKKREYIREFDLKDIEYISKPFFNSFASINNITEIKELSIVFELILENSKVLYTNIIKLNAPSDMNLYIYDVNLYDNGVRCELNTNANLERLLFCNIEI